MSATASEKEIIEQVNILRSNPAGYSSKIESYINYFNGPILKIPEINVQIRTQEGDIPYKETVDFLKNEEPKNPLVPSKALCEIAKEILDKIVDSETGEIDEAETENIIDKHGSFSGKFTRAMDFGGFTSEQVVINFLVCDGDTDRTQREPLLGKGLKKIGVAFGKHSIYTTVCVLVSCTEFTNTVDSDDTPAFPDPEKLPEEEKKREEEKKKQYEKEKLAEDKKKREEEEKKQYEKEKLAKEEKKREEEEKKQYEKEKLAEEKKKKEEEEKKQREERMRKQEEKRKLEAEKRKQEAEKKKNATTSKGGSGNPFQFPKKKFLAVTAVNKEELPEGVASMTMKDTIVIEGGKRYKKIITTKVMLDGTKQVEEKKQCLD